MHEISEMYQVEVSSPSIDYHIDKLPEWQSHFDKYCIKAGSFEIPRPFMIRAKMTNDGLVYCNKSRMPVLSGGLCPYGERYLEEYKVWVFVLLGVNDHFLINQDRVVEPDMDEYKKYFKKDVENMTYFIRNKINKALGEEISRVAVRKK